VRDNHRGGAERVLELVAERAPSGFKCLDNVITSAELAEIVGGYARLTGLANTDSTCEAADGLCQETTFGCPDP
jgi:hypothetical protein